MARRRKEESLVAVLLAAPWQLSAGFAVAVFIALKWVVPSMASGHLFLKAIATPLSQLAWLFSGFFLLIAGVRYFKTAAANKSPLAEAQAASKAIWPTPGRAAGTDDARRSPTAPEKDSSRPADVTPKPTEWSIELIRAIEWKRFEDVCQKIYELKGIRSDTTPLGPDGGIDIRLYQDDSGKPTTIVQCKAWGERYVGVKPVRELLGVMTHEKIGKGFFMTTGYYSDDAKELAKSNPITLMDGDMLLMMILRLPLDARSQLLAFATAGDYTTPTCPTCGIKMQSMPGKNGRPDFWGCRDYPKCRQRPLTKRAGAKETIQ